MPVSENCSACSAAGSLGDGDSSRSRAAAPKWPLRLPHSEQHEQKSDTRRALWSVFSFSAVAAAADARKLKAEPTVVSSLTKTQSRRLTSLHFRNSQKTEILVGGL